MECKWIGTFGDPTGYSKLNREIVKNLKHFNVNVKLNICDIDRIKKENLLDGLNYFKALSSDRAFYFNIYSKIYTDHLKLDKHKKNILFGMNESKDILKHDIDRAKEFNEIWVPSDFCVTAYKQKGISNIYKIPLGVDEDRYIPKEKVGRSPFTFLSVFSWSFRKGYDVLLRSYYERFSDNDNVLLVIISKVLGIPSEEGTKHIINCINDIKKEFNKKLPKIKLITHSISEGQLINFYNESDCFVLPTRGEGFCMPLLESGFCKLPIISTNYSGHLEFLNKNNSTLIDIDGFSNVGDDQFFISSYHNTLKFPTLGKGFIDEFGNHMLNIFNNKDSYNDKSNLLYNEIKNKFTWKNTALNVINRLSKI